MRVDLKPIKTVLLIVFVSLNIFFVLSLIDDFDGVMSNFSMFFSPSSAELEPSEVEAIQKTVRTFNQQLSQAYLERKPQILSPDIASDSLRNIYSGDIHFLERIGRILEVTISSSETVNAALLSEGFAQLRTKESVKLRYLSLKDQSVMEEMPDEIYTMNYSLKKLESSWRLEDAAPVKAKPAEL